jgi:glycosyltransferase involved in cell wall biosynthesis
MQQVERKIHVVVDMTFPRRLGTGGSTVYADELVAALRERAIYRITCIAEQLPVRRRGAWRIWNGVHNLLWTQLVLPLKLLWLRADILHAPSYFAPILCPCPLVLTVHDAFYLKNPPTRRGKLWALYARFFIGRAIRRAKIICTISNVSRDEIKATNRIPVDRIRVTHLGVNPRYQPQAEAELELVRQKYCLSRPFFLFVGSWVRRKNIPRLIDAFQTFRKNVEADYELILVGPQDSGATEVLSLLQDPEIAKRVRSLGIVADEDMPRIYGSSEALVFPSLGEGFGLPIIEAMACGTPVIASGVSCLPEVAGDAALFINPEDPADIARAMKLVLRPDMRQKLKEKGSQRAQLFTWEHTAMETETAYADALR